MPAHHGWISPARRADKKEETSVFPFLRVTPFPCAPRRGFRARQAVPPNCCCDRQGLACHPLVFMWSVSHMKDIHRTFEYHGAEHKTIFCYEAGGADGRERPPPEKVPPPLRHELYVCAYHHRDDRLVDRVFDYRQTNPFLRMLAHLILLPLVVGISYEFNRPQGGS